MINLGNNKSYQRVQHTIPAQSVYTVDFNGNHPNYYRLNNMSNTVLYCATNSYPKADLYDFKAGAHSVGNFAEPSVRDKIFIFNPSTEDAKIILVTWADEFDPTFMAVSEITLDTEGEIKTDGAIRSFETSLPAGNHKIGKVEVTNTKDSEILSGIIGVKSAIESLQDKTVSKHLEDIKNNTNLNDNELLLGIHQEAGKHSIGLSTVNSILEQIKQNTFDTAKYCDEVSQLSIDAFYPMVGAQLDNANPYLKTLNDKLSSILDKMLINDNITSKKIVALDFIESPISVDLNNLNLNGYTINKILGVNNPEVQPKVLIRQFVIKENGAEDNSYFLTIDMWNELYAGKGATFFDATCDTDPMDSKLIIEVVK